MSEKNYKIEKVEKLPDSLATITGELTLDYLNGSRKEAINHLQSHINLPGFRKGKIPEEVLIKAVGEMHVLEETAEIALGKVYGQIIIESGLKPMLRPEISITKLAPGIPLSFKISLVLEPEFELPDYKKIAKEIVAAQVEKKEGEEKNDEVKTDESESRRLKILEKIISETKVELPKQFVEGEMIHTLSHFKSDVEKAGLKWDDYLKKIEKTEEEVKESWREPILSRTKAELILAKIAEKENLKTYPEIFQMLESKA